MGLQGLDYMPLLRLSKPNLAAISVSSVRVIVKPEETTADWHLLHAQLDKSENASKQKLMNMFKLS